MTPKQCLQARNVLGWTKGRLASRAEASEKMVSRFEAGRQAKQADVIAALRAALESAGVEFTSGAAPGVRLCKPAP